MKPRDLLALLLLVVLPMPVSAADVVIRIVDGLGRPVAGTAVKILPAFTIQPAGVEPVGFLLFLD